MNKKLAPLRPKNDVTHELQLKSYERTNRFYVVVTSYGRNQNRDEIKNRAGRIPEATPNVKTSKKQ